MDVLKIPAKRLLFADGMSRPGHCRATSPLLCSALAVVEEELGRRVEQPIELTAETLWTEVAGRLKGALNESTYRTWFGEVEGCEVDGRHVRPRRPEQLHARVDRGSLPRLIRAAVRDATGQQRRVAADRRRRLGAASPDDDAGRRPSGSAIGPEPEVHVRPVRDRLVEPLRARGRARRRRGAGAGLQPALHLRRRPGSARRTCSRRSRST